MSLSRQRLSVYIPPDPICGLVQQEAPIPTLLIGFYSPAGELIDTYEIPDPRPAWCEAYNLLNAERDGASEARPVVFSQEGGAV